MSPSVVIVAAVTLMPARLPVRVLSLLQHSSKARVLTRGCSPCHRSRSFAAAQLRHRQRRRRLADARALTSAQLIIAAADQHTTGGRLALPSLSLSLRISSTSPSVVIEPAVSLLPARMRHAKTRAINNRCCSSAALQVCHRRVARLAVALAPAHQLQVAVTQSSWTPPCC